MAKTYEVVVYDDDGAGVTSAITEYDRVDGGQLSYVGRAFLDADETSVVLHYLTNPVARRRWLATERALYPLSAFRGESALTEISGRPSVFTIPHPSPEAPGHGD